MSEELKSLRAVCNTIGMMAVLVSSFMWVASNNNSIFLVIGNIAAAIALIAYSIEFGAQVVINGEKPDKIIAICGIVIMLFYIIWNVMIALKVI